jgi:hypothetical protein
MEGDLPRLSIDSSSRVDSCGLGRSVAMKNTKPSLLDICSSRIGETYRVFPSIEEFNAWATFQLRDLFCKSRLTDTQPSGRTEEA